MSLLVAILVAIILLGSESGRTLLCLGTGTAIAVLCAPVILLALLLRWLFS